MKKKVFLPNVIEEVEDVVDEEDSFLLTCGTLKLVGLDSKLGLVGGGEQGWTMISGRFKVSFCLRLCELPLRGLVLKGELGTEDNSEVGWSLQCIRERTVLSDSVED